MDAALPGARYCTGCAVTAWPELELPYADNSYNGSLIPGAHRQVAGDPRVLLTAPNAVNYFRGDVQMKAARWTGSGVEVLAAATGHGALAAYGPPSKVPYLTGPETAFATQVRERVTDDTLVVDVIGMRDRNVDVCLGMGPLPDERSKELAARLASGFTRRGVRAAVNAPFPAMAPVTVTAWAQTELGVSALQVGIVAWLRDPVGSPTMAKLVLDVLRDSLAAVT